MCTRALARDQCVAEATDWNGAGRRPLCERTMRTSRTKLVSYKLPLIKETRRKLELSQSGPLKLQSTSGLFTLFVVAQ